MEEDKTYKELECRFYRDVIGHGDEYSAAFTFILKELYEIKKEIESKKTESY